MVDKRLEACGIHLARHHPVAQPGTIMASRPKPPVVQHETFDTYRSSSIGKGAQLFGVVIKVSGFPRVNQHLARLWCTCAVAACGAVHHPTGRCQTFGTVCTNHYRRGIRSAWVKTHLTGQQQLPKLCIPATIRQHFGKQRMITAPLEMTTPHLARPLTGIGATPPQHWWILVRSATCAILCRPCAVVHRVSVSSGFTGPTSRICDEILRLRWHRQRHGERVQQIARVTLVGDNCTHPQRTRFGEFDSCVKSQTCHLVARRSIY